MSRARCAAAAVPAALVCAGAAGAGPGADRDVRALAAAIRTNHPSPYHSVSPAQLDAAVHALAVRASGLHDDAVLVSGWEVFVPPVFVVSVPGDDRVAVEPQIPVSLASADFFAGRDPVLDAVRAR